MIQCDKVYVQLDRKEILKDVSLEARKGEICVIIGRNGSGKTTLLRAMDGLISLREGTIRLEDKSLQEYSARDIAKKAAYLPQHPAAPRITVEELVSFGRAPYGLSPGRQGRKDRQIVEEALADSGLDAFRNQWVSSLSGGERQLAYITLANVQQTDFMLMDEPTAGLDARKKRYLFDLLTRKKEEGKGIILSLHDLEDACLLADHLVVLEQGRKVFDGSPEGFMDSTVPMEVFGKQPVRVQDEAFNAFTVFRDVRN
ncbi:MAG: ABC transporter ATP-binding protein [Lachnospiraceae bacterium]|nr:ABC transporter ATP-binding protein [Lachnospiraceae bacterium]